jgi:rhodanese-related sulfurtransferase
MKRLTNITFLAITVFFSGCSSGQSQDVNTNLNATEFSKKIAENSTAVVLDVRTPEEYSVGHLTNARNIDWNGKDFDKLVSTLDKTKPVFVYCHSGRRSAAAASQMRSLGFTAVFELVGGIKAWQNEKLPISNELQK